MSDRMLAERLQPSLLDRLTDPSNRTERRDDRVIDLRQLREILQRDLAWLLNTTDASATFGDQIVKNPDYAHIVYDRKGRQRNGAEVFEELFPQTANSVVNYGVRAVAGDYSTVERAELIRKSIVAAVTRFEPRILPGSVDVALRVGEDLRQSVVNYDIRADMWAQPLPMELYLRSQMDVTTGEVTLDRVA